MKKTIVITGVVLLVIGVVVFFATSSEVEGHSSVGSKMISKSSSEWASTEINTTSGTDVIITTNSNLSLGLIPSSDIQSVSPANLHRYSVSPSSQNNASGEHITTFSVNSGSYYVVTYSAPQPSLHYTVVHESHFVSVMDFANFISIMVIAGGFVITIIGVLLGIRKNR